MKFTLIKEDNQVGIDGLFFEIDLSSLPENIRAVQWNGQTGHEELIDGENVKLKSITKYNNIIKKWNHQKSELDKKKANPFHGMSKEDTKEGVWSKIKIERQFRYWGGVKVMNYWFSTDYDSRLKFIGLKDELDETEGDDNDPIVIDGESLFWKTMNNLFVPMSRLMLKKIIKEIRILDKRVFKAAEEHKKAMESSDTPDTYDYSVNWPQSYKDVI